MESKVISVRVGSELLDKINEVASRYYPKSYTGQPNRSELFLAALRLFCELADAGVFENTNMEFLSASSIVNSVNSTVNSVDNQQQLIEAMKQELLPEIEKLLEKRSSTQFTVKDSNLDSFVNSVDDQDTIQLSEAYALAKARGYQGTASSFSNRFTRSKQDDYTSHGIARISQGEKKPGLYIDLLKNNE